MSTSPIRQVFETSAPTDLVNIQRPNAGGFTAIDAAVTVESLLAGGGGGGVGTLQQVTDLGNTTTNDIQLLNDANAIFGAGGGILLDNGSIVREGTIDAGLSGAKGVAQICSVGYESKWEAGRQYIMNQGGTIIRQSLYNFSNIPSSNDDATKGYQVGSRWVLDNGDGYTCTDNSTGLATWLLDSPYSSGTIAPVVVSYNGFAAISIGEIISSWTRVGEIITFAAPLNLTIDVLETGGDITITLPEMINTLSGSSESFIATTYNNTLGTEKVIIYPNLGTQNITIEASGYAAGDSVNISIICIYKR